MALITRLTRLFRADMHALLDSMEEPEQMLRQNIREMEEDLFADRQRQRNLLQERDRMQHRISGSKDNLERIELELDLCFSSQKENLARSLMRRKLESQRWIQHWTLQISVLDKKLAALQQRIGEHEAYLQQLGEQVDALIPQEHACESVSMGDRNEIFVSEEDVEIAFLQEQKKRGQS